MELFIPVEIFRKKSNTFRGITFFPFFPKRPKFSVPFVRITNARLHVERKRKIYRYFVDGTTQSRSLFSVPKKYQYHLTEIFLRNFRTNGKRSWIDFGFNSIGQQRTEKRAREITYNCVFPFALLSMIPIVLHVSTFGFSHSTLSFFLNLILVLPGFPRCRTWSHTERKVF